MRHYHFPSMKSLAEVLTINTHFLWSQANYFLACITIHVSAELLSTALCNHNHFVCYKLLFFWHMTPIN